MKLLLLNILAIILISVGVFSLLIWRALYFDQEYFGPTPLEVHFLYGGGGLLLIILAVLVFWKSKFKKTRGESGASATDMDTL